MSVLRTAIVLAGVTSLAGADWARFRGPNGSGAADAKGIPEKWSVKDAAWNVELPGPGNGSPIVSGGKVYLQASSTDFAKRWLLCYDVATGHLDWTATATGHKPPDKGLHKYNSMASSTPAADGERVYCIFWDGTDFTLHAFDLAGKPVWEKDLGAYKSQHGVGSSPMVFGGRVYVNFDQDGKASFRVFDAKTGDAQTDEKRKPFRACYSTPIVRDLPGGTSEILVCSTQGITGYPATGGAATWTWDWPFPPEKPLRTVGGPILVDDVVFLYSGDGDGSRHAVAVSVGPNPKLLWEKKRDTPYVPMPVVKDGYLYWIHDSGLVSCVEAKTGKETWGQERLNMKAVFASLILTGDRITAISEEGRVVVFRANPEKFEKVMETSLGEMVYATPAVADGKMFVRTARHLICIGSK
jgi:outer membrane protein assembly factor BamB